MTSLFGRLIAIAIAVSAAACGDKGTDSGSTSDTDIDIDTDTDTDTDADTDTDTDTDTDAKRTCSDLPQATAEMAAAEGIESGQSYIVCGLNPDGSTCPTYDKINATSFLQNTIGYPGGDASCWYVGSMVCGPEAAITDGCCYEILIEGADCA